MARNVRALNALSFRERLFDEPSDDFHKFFPDQKDVPITLPPKSFAEIYLHETIKFDLQRYSTRLDLRSSRGRLILTLDSMLVKNSEEGRYVSLWNNNPNPITLYGQSKFGQLFFYPHRKKDSDGHIVTDPEEAADIAATICQGEYEMYGPYVILTVGDNVMKFKENIGPIDTNKKKPKEEMYDSFPTDTPVYLLPNEAVVGQLHPQLELPEDVGLQILHSIPFVQSGVGITSPDPDLLYVDHHSANAGWVDPGYQGFVTGHPIRRKFIDVLEKGKPIALGLLYKYNQPVEVPYGSEVLGSHYQGSKGDVSKS